MVCILQLRVARFNRFASTIGAYLVAQVDVDHLWARRTSTKIRPTRSLVVVYGMAVVVQVGLYGGRGSRDKYTSIKCGGGVVVLWC